MKIKFWKHKYALMTLLIAIGTTFLSILFVWIFTSNKSAKMPLLIASFSILLFGILLLFVKKSNIISKLVFSPEGIEEKRFKKQITNIKWIDVVEVKATSYGKAGKWLSFVTNDKQIDMDITKKIYVTIMALCPYQNVKVMLNNVDNFRILFDRYNKGMK